MKIEKIDLLLHPIRTRIIQQLIVNRAMTTMQLKDKLNDVPQATLYRHVKLLLEAGIVRVMEITKVNKKAEYVYEVAIEKLRGLQSSTDTDLPEDHIQYVSTFLSSLLKQATTYITKNSPERYQQDGFNYWFAFMHLTDDEFHQLSCSINSLIAEAVKKEKTPERKTRNYAFMFIP